MRAFWQEDEVQQAVEDIAAVDDLTIVVGAGASVEVGFPMWGALVSRLLVAAVEAAYPSLHEEGRRRLVDDLAGSGSLAAASYAQILLGDRLPTALNKALYTDVRAPRVPGSVSIAVATLFQSLGASAELVTTNYDEQLTRAFADLGFDGAKAVRTGRKRNAAEVLVRHLHGQTSFTGAAEDVVLTEEDYFRPTRRSWQTKFMAERLDGGRALFVGMSLSDPNILRYLHSQSAKPTPGKHAAIFTLPAVSDEMFDVSHRDVLKRKWRSVGVRALYNDFYGQTTQFIYEILQRRQLSGLYVPYEDRLNKWFTDMGSWLFSEGTSGAFQSTQDFLQDRLREARTVVLDLARDEAVHLAPGENISLNLWARRPKHRDIVEVGSAARRYTSIADLPRLPLRPGNPHQVIATFGRDARTLRDLPTESSPWRSMAAFPVALPMGTLLYGRLPVGVITMTSTRSLDDGILGKLNDRLPTVDDYLAGPSGIGQQLLNPTGSPLV